MNSKYTGKYINEEIVKDLYKHLKIVEKIKKNHFDLLQQTEAHINNLSEINNLLVLFKTELKSVADNKHVRSYDLYQDRCYNLDNVAEDIFDLRNHFDFIKNYCDRVKVNYAFYKDFKPKIADLNHGSKKMYELAKWDRWSVGEQIEKMNPHKYLIDFCRI